MPRIVLWIFAGLLLLQGCGHTRTVISLQNIDCQSCGHRVAAELTDQPGVAEATFGLKEAEITVKHDPAVLNTQGLVDLVDGMGYQVVEGSGNGAYTPFPDYPEGADIRWLTKMGHRVDIPGSLAEGKVTVVDFYALWCGPCRQVDKALLDLLQAGSDIAVRKVDIVDWDTPVVRQFGSQLESLPYLEIYGVDGALVDQFVGLNIDRLLAAIEKGGKR